MRVCLTTAYSSDYSIGAICAHVNKNYAIQHGYDFIDQVEVRYAARTTLYITCTILIQLIKFN
jgi:hypothetical protein